MASNRIAVRIPSVVSMAPEERKTCQKHWQASGTENNRGRQHRSFRRAAAFIVLPFVALFRWTVPAFMPSPLISHLGSVSSVKAPIGLESQLTLALIYTKEDGWITPSGGKTDANLAPDLFFYAYFVVVILTVLFGLWWLTKGYFEDRWLMEKINEKNLYMISNEEKVTALDRYDLARLYNKLRDYPASLGQFEEIENEWAEARDLFDPEDAMGALAARAMIHNSKGFALTKVEPAKPLQARRQFVRAVTFWPEYPEALLNIGSELIKRKRYDVAIRTLDAALKWQPQNEYLLSMKEEAMDSMKEDEINAEMGAEGGLKDMEDALHEEEEGVKAVPA